MAYESKLKLNRRSFLGAAAATTAATSTFGIPAVLAQSRGSIKIGVLNSFSKSFAALGNGNLNGLSLYLNSINNEMAGRKIELIREDDEINPQVGLQKLKKLVESDRCDVVCGIQSSAVAMAAVPYIRESKQFFVCSGAGTTALSYVKVPSLFRTSTSGYQNNFTMGQYFYDKIAKEAVLSASDFAGGRDTLREFKLGFEGRGGKVIKEIYPPFNTNDYSSYLADIKAINPPATYHFYAGSDAVRFVKQFAEFGLKGKIKIAGAGFMVESDVLPAQGRDAIGILSSLHYTNTVDSPENKKFVAEYRAKYNEYPSVYAEYGYVFGRAFHEAVKATGGDTNGDKLAAAMLNVRFAAPRGAFAIDPNTHSVINPMYVREVAEFDGRIDNKVVAIFRNLKDPAANPSG